MALAALVVGSGCSGGSGGSGEGDRSTDAADSVDAGVLDPIDVASVDRRSELRAQLGSPDAFTIRAGEFDGSVSSFETWTYYSASTQIDLVDGEIAWTVPIEPLPDGSLLPVLYDPEEFELLSSSAVVFGALGDVELEPIDGAADGFGVEGAELWAGEQLLVAFVDDQLIYVETYPLAPDDRTVAG